MATRMLQRRGTAAEWAAQNPVLSAGEIGFETDTKVVKLGDGVTAWNDLTGPYLNRAGGTMTGALILVAPTEDNHAARKVDVDAVASALVDLGEDLTEHEDLTNPHSATSLATAARLVLRDASGRARFATPVNDADVVNKEYADALVKAPEVEIFTASGTWTKPAGAKRVLVHLIGGGGSGSLPSSSNGGGGGGGGGGALFDFDAAVLGATETVTIGSGATGLTGTTTGDGSPGGDTSFGVHLNAKGGGAAGLIGNSYGDSGGNGGAYGGGVGGLGPSDTVTAPEPGGAGYGGGGGGAGSRDYGYDGGLGGGSGRGGGGGGGGVDDISLDGGLGGLAQHGGHGGAGGGSADPENGLIPGGGGGGGTYGKGSGDGARGEAYITTYF